jgi:ribose 5-phosphate isomerase A
MNQETLKQAVANAALKYIANETIIGIGTGSTVNYFIDALANQKHRIEATIASSNASAEKLKAHGIPVYELNSVDSVPVYVDGTDEFNKHLYLTKGGGGALTREKIIAHAAKKFICLADTSKKVDILGIKYPIPIEVIPMARSFVARQIVKLGGDPVFRENFRTDNGNFILDIHNLKLIDPIHWEKMLNQIPGVVENGIFAERCADILLLSTNSGIEILQRGQ